MGNKYEKMKNSPFAVDDVISLQRGIFSHEYLSISLSRDGSTR